MRWLPLLLLTACPAPHVAPPAPPPEGRPVLPMAPTRTPLPVWIDADPSVGVAGRDVDDGLALAQAFASPELDIRGVSIVFGNAPLTDTEPIGRQLVAAFAANTTPVFAGAASASDHGTATPASDAIIAALEQGPLILLVLGPATNVATALAARPDLVAHVVDIVAVAGRREGQRFTTGDTNLRGHRDLNFESDAAAFQTLLDLRAPLTLAPWELSHHVWLGTRELDALATGPAALAPLIEPARAWRQLWEDTFSVQGFNPFDTLAVAWLLRPDLLKCTAGYAVIEQHPDDRTAPALRKEAAPPKPYLIVRNGPDVPGAPVRYCHDVEVGAFTSDLMGRLMRADGP